MEKERKNLQYLKGAEYNSCTNFLLYSIRLNEKIISYNTLKKLGFINCYLYNKTGKGVVYHKDSLALLFNPGKSFYEETWDEFVEYAKTCNNLIEIVELDYCVILLWFKIFPEYLPNLRQNYKAGFFSRFKRNYSRHLNPRERAICERSRELQMKLEISLGLEENELDGIELATKPEKEDYTLYYE